MCSSLENDQLWEISHHPVMIICLEQQASMRFIPFVKACGLYSESQWEKVNPLCRTALQSYLKFNEHSDFSLSKEEEKKKKKERREKKEQAGTQPSVSLVYISSPPLQLKTKQN